MTDYYVHLKVVSSFKPARRDYTTDTELLPHYRVQSEGWEGTNNVFKIRFSMTQDNHYQFSSLVNLLFATQKSLIHNLFSY